VRPIDGSAGDGVKSLVYDEDWGDGLQRGHDEYMDLLYASSEEEPIADITGEPFCGCDVCERRASWSYLLIHGIEAYREGSLKLEDGDGDVADRRM
jgi:hypothetical protein